MKNDEQLITTDQRRDYETEIAYYEAIVQSALAERNYDTAYTYQLAAYYARRSQEQTEQAK